MVPIISRCPSSSVPRGQSKCATLPKNKAGQGFPALLTAENTNVRIPGYLFSMEVEQSCDRRRDKPVWQVDVCAALPDDRTPRGGTVR